MQHRLSTSFAAIYLNKLHIFVVRFTVALGVLICFLTTMLPRPRSLAISFWGIFELIRSLSSDDADGNENGKKAIGLISKTTTLHVHHAFFVHFFAVVARLQRESA